VSLWFLVVPRRLGKYHAVAGHAVDDGFLDGV
jgi:hypothetical protein